MTIHQVTRDFDFANVHLANPVPLQNGSYFTKINYTAADESLYIYTPKCTTKGIVTAGAKSYMDLVFTSTNTNLIEYMHALEEHVQNALYEKRSDWFSDELELDDIQSVFVPILKLYKGAQQYVMRVYLQQGRRLMDKPPQVYDEHETPRSLSDVRAGTELIAILDLQGIKFTSKSFAVNVVVKQLMIVDHTPVFSQCLIKPTVAFRELEVDTGPLEGEPLTLRKPEEVYGGIYRTAVEKARKAKQESIESFQMAEKIRKQHALNFDDELEY